MTRTRVLAALVMAPTAIAAILLLPTPWLAAVAALVMLAGLWEWLKLAGVDDSLPRTVLVGLNLLLMVLLVWASRADGGFSPVLFQLVTLPVEFNASARAIETIEGQGLLEDDELRGAKKVLHAAALTYVAALLTSLLQLMRFVAIFAARGGGGNRRGGGR